VASIIEHTLSTLKGVKPHLTEAFLRSDNAGCYHTAFLLLSLPSIGVRTGIEVARYDFSEPQAGKDICDRRIAAIKSRMRHFINEGNDVRTAADMKAAIESHGGVKGCYAAVCKVQATSQTMEKHTMTGVQSLNNFSYVAGGLRAWRAYNLGPGKFFTQAMLARFGSPQGDTNMVIVLPFGTPSVEVGTFLTARPSSEQPSQSQTEPAVQLDHGEEQDEDDAVHFACPEEGCIKMYQSFSALQKHLDVGKHLIRLERASQFDEIKKKWAETCESLAGSYIQALPSTSAAIEQPDDQSGTPSAEEGWALKKARRAVHFTEKARNYLREVFLLGEDTGKKSNPTDVATRMKSLREDSGKKRFEKREWLTAEQISRYFSRLSALHKSGRLPANQPEAPTDDADDDDVFIQEAVTINTRRKIRRELEL